MMAVINDFGGGSGDRPGTLPILPPIFPTTSLYVGDLHPDVSEAMLFEKFSITGRVLSIRVCRDMTSRRSLGYAYVNFQHGIDAERAMDAMNFTEIGGKPIRIMWSQRDPALRKSGVGNIFIKNLDLLIGTKDIYDTFSTFGTILSCKVATTYDGISKGFGFVHFETQEAATKAIDKVNGMLLCDKKLFVGHFIPRRERLRMVSQQPKTFMNIYVKDIPESYDDEKLKELFLPYGIIISCHIMQDKFGKSKGFGFVAYSTPEAAQKACSELNGLEIDNKTLYVGRAQKKAERLSRFYGINLYVKNLDEITTDEDLKNEFQRFGEITSAKVMKTEDGRSRGFGFVCFTSPDEATRAISGLNSKLRNGKYLYVGLAQRREERKELLASYFTHRLSDIENNNNTKMSSQIGGGQTYGSTSTNYFVPPTSQPHHQHQQTYYPPQPPAHEQMGGGLMPSPRWYTPPMRQGGYPQGMLPPAHLRSARPMQSRYPVNGNNNNRAHYGRQTQGGIQQNVRSQPNLSAQPPPPTPLSATTSGSGSGVSTSAYSNTSVTVSAASSSSKLSSPPSKTFKEAATSESIDEKKPVSPSSSVDTEFTNTSPNSQKQLLGERLFPLVQKKQHVLAGKVTGMLLEMQNEEILRLLEDPELLQTRLDEAMITLEQHNQEVNSTTNN